MERPEGVEARAVEAQRVGQGAEPDQALGVEPMLLEAGGELARGSGDEATQAGATSKPATGKCVITGPVSGVSRASTSSSDPHATSRPATGILP